MGKKIAILTTHRANNFGAQLQTFALVTTMRTLGVDAEVLDWRCGHFELCYHRIWRWWWQKNMFNVIKRLLFFLTTNRLISKRFDAFRKFYPISKQKFENKTELSQIVTGYDCFVVGSDQIWNPVNSCQDKISFDQTYMLDFVADRKKKKAYAASIGVVKLDPESLIPEYQRLLSTFSYITMREETGADLIESLIGARPSVVLDPVLLQPRDFWKQYFGEILHSSSVPYVFIYNIKQSKLLITEAIKYSRRKGLKVVEVFLPSNPWHARGKVDFRVQAGPGEFLRLIDHAEVVFTNSFHGTAISTLFHKNVFVEMNNISGNANSRIVTLFNTCGLTKYAHEYTKEGDKIIHEIRDVNWLEVDRNLDIARQESLRHLQDIVR